MGFFSRLVFGVLLIYSGIKALFARARASKSVPAFAREVFWALLGWMMGSLSVAWKPWQPDATLCNVELQVFATEAKHNWKVTSNIGHMWFPGPRSPMEFRSLEAIFNKPSFPWSLLAQASRTTVFGVGSTA